MKKNITKTEEKALLEIAKRLMLGRLAMQGLGRQWKKPTCWARQNAKPRQPDTAPHRGLCHGWQNNPNEPKKPQTGADVAA